MNKRLAGWDYRSEGEYFVTICTKDQQCFFGKVIKGGMVLSEEGKIAKKYWEEIPKHFNYVILDAYMVMPNHIHGIVIIDDDFGYSNDSASASRIQNPIADPKNPMSQIAPKSGSLSIIIGAFKSACSKNIREMGYKNFAWQRRFYDHIIRDNEAFERIRTYIINNPANWKVDRNRDPRGTEEIRIGNA